MLNINQVKQLINEPDISNEEIEEILDKAAEKMAEIFVAQADAENNKQSKNKLIKKI